ncbi:CotH kinase family protein [Sporosarcina sp. Te-1]|uniref:CotH kinase family protein n=1 Tax=Sporosarcina sp. Te-1 TaxID=2818390 RepID=UPI001AA00470|nr:CotH kinase family protein [Sporosarcina sp. Te-1]QTD42960.1 CotH kinase family protein [Sporosarcina sp. Te-1]
MDYQVPSFFLHIDQENLDELRHDIWNDEPLPADLKIEDTIYDIDIAYRGSYTRKFRKRSYRIEFIHPEFYEDAREIHLNAEYNDPSFIRNKLSFDFFHDIGVLAPKTQHINLFRNGTRKGVYLQIESVDDYFLKKRGLSPGPIYYAVNNNANFSLLRDDKLKKSLTSGYERASGEEIDDARLIEFITKINTAPLSDLHKEIKNHLNIDTFLRWLAGAICTMNYDGFTHNYALYQNRETRLFELIPWDYDATWGRQVDGGVMKYDYISIEGKKSNHLCYLLLRIPEIRKRYRAIVEEILETQFTVEKMEKKVSLLHKALRPHVLQDPYKQKVIEKFDSEPEFIFQFIRNRNRYLKEELVRF